MGKSSIAFKAPYTYRSKYPRAEPVQAHFEQSRIHRVGTFPNLEDQMCMFTPDLDLERAKSSPDRLDALVWASTELLVDSPAQAWIDHYGWLAAAARKTISLPAPRTTALPWHATVIANAAENELTTLYRDTLRASFRDEPGHRCAACGKAMEPGATRVTDGVDVWHPACR